MRSFNNQGTHMFLNNQIPEHLDPIHLSCETSKQYKPLHMHEVSDVKMDNMISLCYKMIQKEVRS